MVANVHGTAGNNEMQGAKEMPAFLPWIIGDFLFKVFLIEVPVDETEGQITLRRSCNQTNSSLKD